MPRSRVRGDTEDGFTLIELVIGLALLGLAIATTMTVLTSSTRTIADSRARANAARIAADWTDRAAAFGCGVTTAELPSIEAEATCGTWALTDPAPTGTQLGDFRLQESRNGVVYTVSVIHDYVQLAPGNFGAVPGGLRARCDVNLSLPPDAVRRRAVVTWQEARSGTVNEYVFTSVNALPTDNADFTDTSRGGILLRNTDSVGGPPDGDLAGINGQPASGDIITANPNGAGITVTYTRPIATLDPDSGNRDMFDGNGNDCLWIPFISNIGTVSVAGFPMCTVNRGVTTPCG